MLAVTVSSEKRERERGLDERERKKGSNLFLDLTLTVRFPLLLRYYSIGFFVVCSTVYGTTHYVVSVYGVHTISFSDTKNRSVGGSRSSPAS